jgi:hypothetical protein
VLDILKDSFIKLCLLIKTMKGSGQLGSAEVRFRPLVIVQNFIEKDYPVVAFDVKIDQSFYLVLYAH